LGLEKDAKDPSALGDHARRSLLRKGYLYILLLVSAAGGMATVGQILRQLFMHLLGTEEADFAVLIARRSAFLVLFLIWEIYHLTILQRDARMAHKALERLHARFTTLIIKTGAEDAFPDLLAAALARRAPKLPLTVHQIGADGFDQLGEMRACVFPLAIALNPPNALRVC